LVPQTDNSSGPHAASVYCKIRLVSRYNVRAEDSRNGIARATQELPQLVIKGGPQKDVSRKGLARET